MGSFCINYGDVYQMGTTLKSIWLDELEGHTEELGIGTGAGMADDMFSGMPADLWIEYYLIVYRRIQRNVSNPITTLAQLSYHMQHSISVACADAERRVLEALSSRVTVGDGHNETSTSLMESYADEQAAATAQAKADADAKAEEARQKHERLLELLAKFFPETYAAYLKKLSDAERDAFLAELKESDPELYELAMAELKRQEEAEKAAAEAAAALGESGGLGGLSGSSGLGGADFGGSGDGGGLDFGGSDLGGSGGLGDDWSSDLLDDTLGDDLLGAQDELAGYAGADPFGAVATGVDALANDGDLAEAGSGFWDEYGPQLAAMVQAYGVQAAAAVGGAAALYVTREQTTEAVAHVAEFVSTKCKPAVDDVMKQVSGAAKKTRVSLGNTKSRAVGIARGEEAGGLLG